MTLTIAYFIWGSLATIGMLASAFVRWRSSSDETTGALWKGEAEAQKARADRLEDALNSLEKRVERIEQENETLRALHNYRDELSALRTGIDSVLASIACRVPEKVS